MMTESPVAILAIDCAWSAKGGSGVVAGEFSGGKFNQNPLLSSCPKFLGKDGKEGREVLERFTQEYDSKPRIICVDVPLSNPIQTGRRPCDNAVSRFFGRAHCSTHSVTGAQVEPVKQWNELLAKEGRLCTSVADVETQLAGGGCALIETYPHPAILGLLRIEERLKYKVGRYRRYWPKVDSQQRKLNLCQELQRLKSALSEGGFDSDVKIDAEMTLKELKETEDVLDALVCAWVAVRTISRDALPVIDDKSSTIWIPSKSFDMMNKDHGSTAMM